MKKLKIEIGVIVFLWLWGSSTLMGGQIWNLSNDWDGSATLPAEWAFSSMPWIGDTGPTVPAPLNLYQESWFPQFLADPNDQSAFANGVGSIPGFGRSTNDSPFDKDYLKGDIIFHGQGVIQWTSPIDGTVKVSSAAWGVESTSNKQELFILEDGIFNGTQRDHHLGSFSGLTTSRANPLSGQITFPVTTGQVVGVWIPSGAATFGAVSVEIEDVTQPQDPNQEWELSTDWDGSSSLSPPWFFAQMNFATPSVINQYLMKNYVATWLAAELADPNPQPAFAPGVGGIPGFARSVNNNPLGKDYLVDDIVMHGQALIGWISPLNGTIQVDATAWGVESPGFSQDLYILEDGIFDNDAKDHLIGSFSGATNPRNNPLSGSATFAVRKNQRVAIWIPSGAATFAGVTAQISIIALGDQNAPPLPWCEAQPLFDLNGDCWVNLLDFSIFLLEWLDCGLDLQDQCF